MGPFLPPWNGRVSFAWPWERVAVRGSDLPRAAVRADEGCGRELCCRAGPEVPDLCLVLVPGTVRLLDGKFLAGQAPRQQFE